MAGRQILVRAPDYLRESRWKPLRTHESTPRRPTVRALDDRLVIERLEVEDERSAQLVRERIEAGQSGEETVRDAIEIGARVLEREGAGGRGRLRPARVRADLRPGPRAVRRAGERADREGSGRAAAGLRRRGRRDGAGARCPRRGARRPDHPPFRRGEHRGRPAPRPRAGREGDARIARGAGPPPLQRGRVEPARRLQALASTRRSSRPGAARRAGQGDAGEARGAGDRESPGSPSRPRPARSWPRPRRRGPARAASFEERVHEAIERIAEARGDAAFHVGDEPGKGGSKKGDTVVEVDGGRGARDRADRLRGEEQQARQEGRLGGAERGDGRARGELRGPGRRRGGARSPPAASSCTSTRATS